MGVNASPDELDAVASGFIEELELVNLRPIDPDMLAIFFDGKYVDIKEDDRLRPACIYLVTGLHRDGRKKVLGCFIKHGRENLEGYKQKMLYADFRKQELFVPLPTSARILRQAP